MGLDMYLDRSKVVDGIKIWELYPDEVKQSDPVLHEKLKEYEYTKGSADYTWQSYSGRVGYWRKANHIHKWFVDNVQFGEDNCQNYFVTKDHLMRLYEAAKQVVDCFNADGAVKRGKQKIVSETLPTCDGFFFGSTQYNEWYLRSTQDTISIIEEALYGDKAIDWDNEVLVYCSSW